MKTTEEIAEEMKQDIEYFKYGWWRKMVINDTINRVCSKKEKSV